MLSNKYIINRHFIIKRIIPSHQNSPIHRTQPTPTGVVRWTAPCRPLIRTVPTMRRPHPASLAAVAVVQPITRAGIDRQMSNENQHTKLFIYLLETGYSRGIPKCDTNTHRKSTHLFNYTKKDEVYNTMMMAQKLYNMIR